MASDTRSPSTPGTKSWEVAKMRPRKILARNMLGRRISTVGDLGWRTESLKQKKLVGNIFKNLIDIGNHDTVGTKKDLADTDNTCPYKMTTSHKTFQNFSKLFKTFQNFSKLFKNFSKLFDKMTTFH